MWLTIRQATVMHSATKTIPLLGKGQCDGYRVEDGYYAILPNPDYSNCGKAVDDYWAGNDHTEGDVEGGMLFVNCSANSRNTIIYQRTVHTKSSCANTQLLFSAYINNAAIAAGSTPVNVRLDVLDENKNWFTVGFG